MTDSPGDGFRFHDAEGVPYSDNAVWYQAQRAREELILALDRIRFLSRLGLHGPLSELDPKIVGRVVLALEGLV